MHRIDPAEEEKKSVRVLKMYRKMRNIVATRVRLRYYNRTPDFPSRLPPEPLAIDSVRIGNVMLFSIAMESLFGAWAQLFGMFCVWGMLYVVQWEDLSVSNALFSYIGTVCLLETTS